MCDASFADVEERGNPDSAPADPNPDVEEMRGTRKAIPWSSVTKHIEGLNPTYNFQEDAYRRWFNNPDRGVDEKVLINLENFVQHFDKYTDRGARSAARAAARRILDEEINLGDETEREDQDMTTVDDTQTQPRKRARPGPDAGTKQGNLTQIITRFGQDEEWTVPPKWRMISDA